MVVEDPSVPVVCRACERKVMMSQIKFDDIRKAFVCQSCYNSTHPTKPKMEKKDFDTGKQESRRTVEEGLEKYNCPDCKYYFSRKKGKALSSCPYCGSKNIVKASGHTADKVIKESGYYDF